MIRSKAYYQREFIENSKSIRQIAEENNTYPNKIKREILAHGFRPRDKSEAQRTALKTGRHKHPTKGKKRPLEVRLKISESVTEYRHNGNKETDTSASRDETDTSVSRDEADPV